MSSNNTFDLTKIIKSERASINLIEPILLDIKVRMRMRDDIFYNVMIAVTEAVNNAINHGNRLNPNKYVTFSVKGSEKELVITVKDEGDGFDPESLDDCTDPDNLLKDSGRGVFIIRELMDKVHIDSSADGTEISMYYYPTEH